MSAPYLRPHQHAVDPTGLLIANTQPALRWDYWARCELCRWSGPQERFVVLEHERFVTYICDHAWCWGNAQVRQQLEREGWVRV